MSDFKYKVNDIVYSIVEGKINRVQISGVGSGYEGKVYTFRNLIGLYPEDDIYTSSDSLIKFLSNNIIYN